MRFLTGLPTYVAGCLALYLVAELGNRWIAISVASVGLGWILVDLHKQASADRRSREAVSPHWERERSS